MANSKNTQRALLASVLSLVLCFAMLVGSTFAWFTDTVSSNGNIIKSGTLDVEMQWADGTESLTDPDTEWKDAAEGAIFNYSLWEPGYTEVRHVKISNVGSLALKYEIRIAATGEVSKLANVIDVYYIKDGQQLTSRTELTDENKIGTLAEVLAKPYAAKGHILAGENAVDVATIALKMQEDAGNEYKGLSIGTDFSVQLVATQYTHEGDSFDDQYDKEAVYPTVELASLKASLKKSGPIILGGNFVTDEDLLAQGKPTVDLNGKTVRFTTDGFGFKANGATSVLTINGDGIVTSNPDGEAGSNIVENDVTEGKAYGAYTVTATNNSKIVINGGHYVANVTAVYAISGGKVEINGGFFDYIRFPGSTIKSSYLLNLKDNTNSSIVVKGGTFVNFDPSNNTAEGPDTNFVAEGYKVIPETQANGDIWYTVVSE